MPKRKPKEYKHHGAVGHKYDLPVRTMEEAEAERKAFFDKAWAQHYARKEAEARGEVFIPEWQKKLNPVFQKSILKPPKPPPKPVGHAAAVTAALNSDSSDDDGPRQQGVKS